jgi:3-hydroxy acid dehydrogenase/malonic semialdehyde reductase
MSKLFENKIVLITGASAGFGASTAAAFAREGAHLLLMARRKDRIEALAKDLKEQYSNKTFSLVADVSNLEAVKNAFKTLPKDFEVPDILINNAGLVRGLDKIWEVKPEDWSEMIDTNLKGVLNVSSQMIPKMIKRNSGHIINIGSISGHDVYPGGGVYCATKFALRALTDTLRMELVATPLRVSLISPGMAQTEFSLVRYQGDHEKAKTVYQGFEALKPEDIAETILFAASRPPHVNVADIIVYPTNQASTMLVHRQ